MTCRTGRSTSCSARTAARGTSQSSFGLVHGSWCAAEHWELLAGELDARGRRCVAVDLPASDPQAGLEEYRDAVLEAVSGLDDVVLVGHSLGGLTIPLVAAARPVRRLVYLCAVLPTPGLSLNDDERMMVDGLDWQQERHEDGTTSLRPGRGIQLLLHDCPEPLARAAAAGLRRQGRRPSSEPWPLEALPDVERVSILCRHERVVSPEWSRRAARERLGVEAVELDGGHCPMLSRPGELADLLCRLA